MKTLKGLDAPTFGAVRRTGAEAVVSLRQRRAWFTDDPNPASGNGETEPDDVSKLPGWAQALIGNLRDENAKKRIAAAQAETKAREAALAEERKFEQLAAERLTQLEAYKPIEERASLLEAKIKATNEGRIKRIPEGMRSVIPADYPPEKLSEWLDANEALLTKAPPPPRDGGRGGEGQLQELPKLTDFERELARQAGISETDYAKRKAERGVAQDFNKST